MRDDARDGRPRESQSRLAGWLQRRGPRRPARESRDQGAPRAKSWLQVMLSGQDTRDPSLKTRRELARDRAKASALRERRRRR